MDVYDQLRELSKPHGEGEKAVSIIERTARMAGLSYSRCYEIYYRRARRIDADESERIGAALEQKTDWMSAMSYRNFGFASPASKTYSFRRTRTFIARLLISCGNRFADLAEKVAPWTKH